jgi:hypothetical protein
VFNKDVVLLDVQRQFFETKGIRTDVYYKDGQGALVVPEGAALHPSNILAHIPEYVFAFGSFSFSM